LITNYPIKAKWVTGNYFIMKTPLKRVKDENEFARIFLRRKKATIEDLKKKLTREDLALLRKEISDSESNWKRF